MLLNELTWPEVKDLISPTQVVILPTGSTEQHGPALPLQMDITGAYEVAKRVGDETGALVAPPLNFGYSEPWRDFPGTMSLSAETFQKAVEELCGSLVRVGFKKIFVLNGHNGNIPMLQTLGFLMADRHSDMGISFAVATYFSMAASELNEMGPNFRDGTHANEFETSLMMALRSDLVKFDKVKDLGDRYAGRLIVAFKGGAMISTRWAKPAEGPGIWGSPHLATAEKGRAYLEVIVKKVSEFVREFSTGKLDPM